LNAPVPVSMVPVIVNPGRKLHAGDEMVSAEPVCTMSTRQLAANGLTATFHGPLMSIAARAGTASRPTPRRPEASSATLPPGMVRPPLESRLHRSAADRQENSPATGSAPERDAAGASAWWRRETSRLQRTVRQDRLGRDGPEQLQRLRHQAGPAGLV